MNDRYYMLLSLPRDIGMTLISWSLRKQDISMLSITFQVVQLILERRPASAILFRPYSTVLQTALQTSENNCGILGPPILISEIMQRKNHVLYDL